mmetsp:Transcript_18251/g.21091  ORF Transcript_18251/g.21091 Transcript_18251/m.21091 type:complete len:488 (-) Transcript_18251:81-1544(-)
MANSFFLSSLGSFTLDDSLSLNSSTLVTNNASKYMITVPLDVAAGMENRQQRHDDEDDDDDDDNDVNCRGECTIVPSIESGGFFIPVPPPEASQDIFVLSPHPRLTVDGIQSISTTSTESIPYGHVYNKTTDNNGDESSLCTSTSVISKTSNRSYIERFEDGAFERVAGRLLIDSSTTPNYNYWYNRLVSESDWDQFRNNTKDFLSTLQSEEDIDLRIFSSVSMPLLPLPPMVPDTTLMLSSVDNKYSSKVPSSLISSSYNEYRAKDHLRSEFICSLCKDVLVGACTLNCNCSFSTVCAPCWNNHNSDDHDDYNQQELAAQMDFVWVETRSKKKGKCCPSCGADVDFKVHYCHALDVAILHIVRDLPESCDVDNSNIKNLIYLKQTYYSRLSTWRNVVNNLNERYRRQKLIHDDELLARLIQEEERVFWQDRSERSQQRRGGTDREQWKRMNTTRKVSNRIIFFGHAAVALIAAAIASTGLKAMTRR